jgi:hypothetical protein
MLSKPQNRRTAFMPSCRHTVTPFRLDAFLTSPVIHNTLSCGQAVTNMAIFLVALSLSTLFNYSLNKLFLYL